jgi:phospholipase C
MFRNKLLRTTAFTLALAGMVSNMAAVTAAQAQTAPAELTLAQKVALLQKNVKYVFVIFAENRSFDHYFGTFPGANGLFRAPAGFTAAKTNAPGTGFSQPIVNVFSGGSVASATTTISPFLAPQAVVNNMGATVKEFPADMVSSSHSHQGIGNSMDWTAEGGAQNDRYALTQEGLTTTNNNGAVGGTIVTASGGTPASIALATKQAGEQGMAHVDCDTVPFLWTWAKNFVLFDNMHQSMVGPSSPNAIELISGQVGETQWALNNAEGPTITAGTGGTVANGRTNVTTVTPLTGAAAFGASYSQTAPAIAGNTTGYVPLETDAGPFPGSKNDKSPVKPPYDNDEGNTNDALNLTYASLPLSFMGSNIGEIISKDQNPKADLLGVQNDIFAVATFNQPVNWGWFQQGFDSNDAADTDEDSIATNASTVDTPTGGYVLHHNAPQFFGYIADNTAELGSAPTAAKPALVGNLHGNADFFSAIANQQLGTSGVFYLRGGLNNNPQTNQANSANNHAALAPSSSLSLTEQVAFAGNDDHPGNSDSQIAESMAADAINAIASSPYWANSAIIITYDESDGLYDHAPIDISDTMADGTPLGGGPRIPTLLISPFAATGTISHVFSQPGSVIKFINHVFGLTPLASLPNEVHGRVLGLAKLGQPNLEPQDDPENALGDLTEAFDYGILQGEKPPLSPSLATFTGAQIASLPHLADPSLVSGVTTNGACAAIGMLPTDFPTQAAYEAGTPMDPAPIDYNPRPGTAPGEPSIAGSTPGSAPTAPWSP